MKPNSPPPVPRDPEARTASTERAAPVEDATAAAYPAAAEPRAAAGVPQGGTSPAGVGAGGARRTAYRALALALGCGALGSGTVLVAAGKTWTKGIAGFGAGGRWVGATGTETTALPGALALVGLAALVAVFAVGAGPAGSRGTVGRYAVSGLLASSGLAVVVAVLAGRGDHGAVDAAAARATGLSDATAAQVVTTAWPPVAAAGGLLLLVAGLLALRYGPRWPAMSSRYERPGASARGRAAAPPVVDPDRAEDLWKAFDRGEDPTRTAG